MRYVLIVLLALVATSARAEGYYIDRFAMSTVSVSGDFWSYSSRPVSNADLTLEFDFNWEANTMTYGDFQLASNGRGHFWGRKTYPTGPGQMNEVNFQAWIDPFSSESSTSTTATLTPTTGSSYRIAGPAHPIGGPLTLTGTYHVTGPTETVEGPWSITLANTPSISYPRLLTDFYPQQIDLLGTGSATWSGGGNIVTTSVNGYPVVVGLNSISYSIAYPAATRTVPEPATLVLTLIGLLCCVLHRSITGKTQTP